MSKEHNREAKWLKDLERETERDRERQRQRQRERDRDTECLVVRPSKKCEKQKLVLNF